MIRIIVALWLSILAALPAAAQIKIEEVTSPGGIKAWLVQEPSIPIISFEIAFRGGTSLDPVDKMGATNLMAGLLGEGAGELDAVAYLKASEELAANFSFGSDRESVQISAQVLKSNAPEALDLLKLAIQKPAFHRDAIQRVRGQVIAGIESDLQDPAMIADKTLAKVAFDGHPYGQPQSGTLDTVRALTRQDLLDMHKMSLTKDHLVIGVVGDISTDELGKMLDDLLGDLPETGAPLPPRVAFGAAGGTTVVNFDTPQSVALWAQPSIGLDHPDFIPLFVMNHILGGGGFGSRLTEEVREKRGLTYGIYSYLAILPASEYLGGSVASANDTIKQAVDLVKAEWARMATEGATTEELEKAQQYLTGSYALRFDGNGQIASILTNMQLSGYALDYINTRNDRVNRVTLDDIARVARTYLKPEDLHFVVVGQPEGLQSTPQPE